MKRQLFTLKQGSKAFGVVLLSAAIMAGCTAAPETVADQKAAAQEQQVKSVKTAKIGKQNIGEPLEQVGDIVSSVQLDVITKAGGEVVEILKKRGDKVAKGDVLFRLDSADVELQQEQTRLSITSAEAQLTKARKDLADGKEELKNSILKLEQTVKNTEKNYNRMRNEYDLGTATKEQLEQAEIQLNNLRLDLDILRKKQSALENTDSLAALELQLQSARLNSKSSERALSNLEVKAPTDGILTELDIKLGMTLTPGFRAGHIQQVEVVSIKSELTEAAANLVKGKTELTFYIPGAADKMKGKIVYLSDVANAQTKSYSLELEVSNADRMLKPGSKAQILLTEESEQIVTVVPTLSIVREGGDNYVYILKGDTVEKRKVELGRLSETNQEIISGVQPGELLVVSGQHQLKDKEKVQSAN